MSTLFPGQSILLYANTVLISMHCMHCKLLCDHASPPAAAPGASAA
jgi:hypothetical protein